MSMDNAKPDLVYVDFDLPFVLFLKDSIEDLELRDWVEALAAGKKPLPYARYAPSSDKPSGMVLGADIPVFLPSKELAELYEISRPGGLVAIRTLRRVNCNRKTVLVGEVPGDRTGKASFSSVRVVLDAESRPDFAADPDLACSIAIEAINFFIDHYRDIADRPFINHVTPQMIQEFYITTVLMDGTESRMEYGKASGAMRGFGGALEPELDAKLRVALLNGGKPSILRILQLNIQDYLDLHDWRLALIESAVLFEAWISSFVRDRFAKKGLPFTDIDAKFLDSRGLPRSVTSIAKKLVLDATGFDFGSTIECSTWETKVRDTRNALVHGKQFDVSPQDANDAVSAVRAAIALLQPK